MGPEAWEAEREGDVEAQEIPHASPHACYWTLSTGTHHEAHGLESVESNPRACGTLQLCGERSGPHESASACLTLR